MQNKIKVAINLNPGLKIQIRADKETRYDKIKKVLKACAEIGGIKLFLLHTNPSD